MAEMSSEITELLAQAMRAIQYGHKPAAAAYLNRILEIDPDNMDAWRWLAECMPNQSKRDYCLERAGLSTAALQSKSYSNHRATAAVSQSSLSDVLDELDEPSLAEQHARRGTLRGQKRAELPPHFHTDLPINIEFPKATANPGRTQSANRKPQNSTSTANRRPARKPRKTVNFKGLVISILLVGAIAFLGYGLFSTGLITGEKAWHWVSLQIKNNTADLAIFGNKPAATPSSLFDQPAEETADASISTDNLPAAATTPQSDGEMAQVSSEEQNLREAAEVPAEAVSTVEPEMVADSNSSEASAGQSPPAADEGESAPAETESASDAAAAAEIPVAVEALTTAEPTGYVAGPKVIGKSVKGNNLEIMQFGNGPVERMMVAGIHGGNEWNTTALADQLIKYIEKNPQVIPADHTLYILRLMNPDGEARGHNLDGRTNERGVDLNRNWDAFWVVDWPRDGCWNYRPISAGSSPFSEPEVVAVRDFIKSHKISALINYHSAALGIFAGGRPPETESVHLAQSIAAVTSYAYPPTDTGCKYTGQFADWLAMNGIAAVDLELANHTDTDFDENLTVLNILMKWEPTSGPKSLTGLINMAKNLPEKPSVLQQIKKFGVQSLNELNGLIFGRQEEK